MICNCILSHLCTWTMNKSNQIKSKLIANATGQRQEEIYIFLPTHPGNQQSCYHSQKTIVRHMLYETRSPTRAFIIVQRFSRAGPRGRAREWATLGVHPLSWLLSNNRLEEVCGTLTKGTFSSRLLLSNQDKGCTPSVAHSLPLSPFFCSTCQTLTSPS